jgi:hypothetical protein
MKETGPALPPESDPTSSGEIPNLPAVSLNLRDFIIRKDPGEITTDPEENSAIRPIISIKDIPASDETPDASTSLLSREIITDIQPEPEVTCNYDWGPTRELIKALYPEPAPQGDNESSLAYTLRLLHHAEGRDWDQNGLTEE